MRGTTADSGYPNSPRYTRHARLKIVGDPSVIGNGLGFDPADTGSDPKVSAIGDDANVNLNVTAKGTGKLTILDGADATKKVAFDVSNVTTATTRTITVPDASGALCVDGLVSVTTATVTLSAAAHGGRAVVLNKAGGVTVTLPAASGSGARFRLYNGTALSAASHVVQVANSSDYMRGAQFTSTDNGSGAGLTWPTANTGTASTESDTLTWNGSTKGGLVGDVVEIVDIAANVWAVRSHAQSTGTEVTPFSAAV